MGKGIVKYRYVILAVFIALIAVSAAFLPTMINRVNYDLTSYLPDDYETSKGYAFLSETFNIHGDVEIGVTATHEEIEQAANEILELEGVTNAVWAQYMEMLLDFGIYSPDDEEFTEMYNIFTDALAKGAATVSADGTLEYKDGAECNWALLVTMKYPPSSQEAIKVFGEIETILKNVAGEGSYAMSGMTEQANALYETVFDELWIYLVAAGIVVLLILAFTTNSLMEPLILVLTLAVSIVINLGTNAIFPSTSMITFAVTAILQLGLSMDYAIFLLHQYRDELRTTCDPKQALAAAIPKSAKAVASSALTTVVGFLALMCMQFEIGTDLGLSLAKGIICSLVTVILLQPCLMLMLDKARVKTQHKCLDFRFRAPIKRSIRDRGWVSLVFAVLFIPALIGSLSLSYTYVRFMPEPDTSGYTEDQLWNYSTAKELGNQVMIIVPNERVDENGDPILDENGDHVYYIEENYEFVRRLTELGAETVQLDGETIEKLSYKLGMYIMIPEGSTITYELLGNSISLTLEQVFDLVNDIFPIVESIDFNDLTTLTQEKLDALFAEAGKIISDDATFTLAGHIFTFAEVKTLATNILPILVTVDFNNLTTLTQEKLDTLFAEAGKIISDDATFTLGGLTFTFADIKAIANNLIPVLAEIDADNIMAHALEILSAIQEVRPDVTLSHLAALYGELSEMEMGDMQSQMAMFQSYVNGGYTMYTVGINPAIDFESQTSFDILDEVKAIANEVFADTGMTCYFTGYTQGAYDFAAVTPGDYNLVTVISIVAILVILIFTLGGIKFPVLLVALIEFGIWINLIMQYIFAGGTVNFMSYLVITAVQLGATVDYAILITTKFRALRKRFEPRQAAYLATTGSVMSVLTSALIMAGACFSIFAVSSNLVIQEMTFLIARGALISAILVIFVLPALLSFADKPTGNELHIPRTLRLRPIPTKRRKKYIPALSQNDESAQHAQN